MRGESLGEILTQARQQKFWTLEEAAEALGVSMSTVERWEKGGSRPQGYHMRQISQVYDLPLELLYQVCGLSPAPPGVHGMQTPDAAPVSEALRDLAMSDLTIRLSVLAISTHRSLYEVQHELRRTLEEFVQDDDITRREALRRLTWLPLLGVLAGNAIPVGSGDSLNQFAASIAACWELCKGDGQDITLAYEQINAYLPQLSEHLQATNSTAQHKTVLTLIAQCYHFKTIMGYHVESLHAARAYGQQALHYGTLVENVPLQIDVAVRLTWIHYYAKQYQQAYTEISTAVEKLKATKTPLPPRLVSQVYAKFAIMQAARQQKQPALSSLGLAHEYFEVPGNDEPLSCYIDASAMGLAQNDGLVHALLGMQSEALASLEQAINTPVSSTSMRVHVQAYNDKVLALLRSPKKEMEPAVSTWITAMQGATILKSEQRWQEAMDNYNIMQVLWPGEPRIQELRELAVHW